MPVAQAAMDSTSSVDCLQGVLSTFWHLFPFLSVLNWFSCRLRPRPPQSPLFGSRSSGQCICGNLAASLPPHFLDCVVTVGVQPEGKPVPTGSTRVPNF